MTLNSLQLRFLSMHNQHWLTQLTALRHETIECIDPEVDYGDNPWTVGEWKLIRLYWNENQYLLHMF